MAGRAAASRRQTKSPGNGGKAPLPDIGRVLPTRRGRRAGPVCSTPACYRFEIEYRRRRVKVEQIDLVSQLTGKVFVSYAPPFKAAARRQAEAALRRAARDGTFELGCQRGCECQFPKNARPVWSAFKDVEVVGTFSAKAPFGVGERIRFQARGKVMARVGTTTGTCIRIVG